MLNKNHELVPPCRCFIQSANLPPVSRRMKNTTKSPQAKLASRARRLAEYEARAVKPDRLAHAISEYIEWRCFSFWARLIVESDGCPSGPMRVLLDSRCPGFLDYAAKYRQERPREREFFWLRLIEWIDNEIFRFAREEGWSHALGFYAAHDPRLDRIREYWALCDDLWKKARPATVPSYEEWRQAASEQGCHLVRPDPKIS
jgi:hypothetical protein